MRRVNARDFAAQFEEFATLAEDEPIEVATAGTPIGVFVSPGAYAHLRQLEDAVLAARAQAAVERDDFLSPEETMRWAKERLSRAK